MDRDGYPAGLGLLRPRSVSSQCRTVLHHSDLSKGPRHSVAEYAPPFIQSVPWPTLSFVSQASFLSVCIVVLKLTFIPLLLHYHRGELCDSLLLLNPSRCWLSLFSLLDPACALAQGTYLLAPNASVNFLTVASGNGNVDSVSYRVHLRSLLAQLRAYPSS